MARKKHVFGNAEIDHKVIQIECIVHGFRKEEG